MRSRTTRVLCSQSGQRSSLARYSSQCLLLLSLMYQYHADRADVGVGSYCSRGSSMVREMFRAISNRLFELDVAI